MQKSRTGKKHWQLLPLLYLSAWFPQSVFRFKEGRKKNKKKNRAKMLFSSPPRLTMRLIRVKGNRKRNSNYSIVAISVCIVTATKQTPDKSRFVLPCHCLSEPMEEMTNCRLEFNFFSMDRWNFNSTLKVQNSFFWGGRRWAWFSCRALLYFVDPILLEQSATSSNTWFYWGEPQVWLI